ncbi:uracil phosphoribosyltransferase [Candidatus Saccharibacteria bacterium]|nr:uracil phosphoribosyltransferase [Candidatus Saccharibacteria bacterium]MBQ9016783.1 uracil phosphoribosyltransferase [Candidatus Saccharibacteria bacterium]
MTKSEIKVLEEVLKHEQSLCVPYPSVRPTHTTHVLSWHPLLMHKITEMRKKDTDSSTFRKLVEEVTTLICCEAMQHLELEEYVVETPICKTIGKRISGKKLVVVPILRAGLGMENAVKAVVPKSRTGIIGMYRDEKTLEPHVYFEKQPNGISEREIFILDPMLATGGSADAAIKLLKEKGCKKISFICIIAAPQGMDLLQKNHPDVELYIGCLDKGLNKDGYIVPGLGDAGDRIFGTK